MTTQRTISNINRQYCELKILYPEMIIKEEAQPLGNKDQTSADTQKINLIILQ